MSSVTRAFSYQALPSRVVFGIGSSRRDLVSEVDKVGARRILVIATKRAEPVAAELAEPLARRVVGVFTEVQEHIPREVAVAARIAARESRADCLLCIGGGSVVGTAKAVALEAGPPIVAVPTTYAGSELTPIWGLTEGGRKRTGRSLDVLPRAVVYDPELTVTLPAVVTAASGMNALAHCVGACTAPGIDPITVLVAEEGVRALVNGLPRVVRTPADLDGRSEVLYGAYLAGTALAVAGTGIHHKICHVLGGTYGLPHAQTHAVLLPYVAVLLDGGLRAVAATLGAERAADGLRELAMRIGAPTSLREIGMRARDIAQAATLVVERVAVAEPTARRLLESAYEGRWEGAR